MLKKDRGQWSFLDSEELYEIKNWGNGYFSVSPDGNVRVHPKRTDDLAIDLKQLIERLQLRGLETPILIRFNDLIRDRLGEIHGAFAKAIADHDYQGTYRCVYPIKVNQQRQVVEQVIQHGAPFGFGLEAGSKPELMAVIALLNDDRPIVCNGFKDAEFIELALMAQKIGRNIIPVIERFTELHLVLQTASRLGVRPQIGMRAKLASRGSGRWESSGGYRSKFGLTVTEILQGLELLDTHGMADCLQLLHYHMGSQVTNIRHVKSALIEAARIYVELARRGAGLKYLDVGGGLGVDYDGSRTNFESSMNYTLQEYANDIIYHVQTVCDDAGVPHPDIMSESGRAIAAYHSVLVFNVLGTTTRGHAAPKLEQPDDELEQPLRDLQNTYADLNLRNARESFHDAQQALDMAIGAFAAGYMPLEQRSAAESYFWAICYEISKLVEQMDHVPEELERLSSMLSETYFCNFSLFQSLPDSWAIDQLFPVMPIHRLNEEPTRRAILGDITCDSDGKIDKFIDRRGVQRTLPLHRLNDEPYLLGIFMIGAYQEILGDLHNLFGDTNAAHVSINDNGEPVVETLIRGDTVTEVLKYVQFRSSELLASLQTSVESAVMNNAITQQEAGEFLKQYEEGLRGYTYLE